MINWRAVAMVTLGLVCATGAVQAQDRSRYRDFQLGSDVSSVVALVKLEPSAAKIIHERPALMRDLEWRPPYFVSGSTLAHTDPVQQIVFSFYNDQLFRLKVDYDRQRTNGMTDGDMIDAIAEAYGPPLKSKPTNPSATVSAIDAESGVPIARWGDPDYSVVLYRSSYASGFRLIVTSPRLDALARTADAQALRLDQREGPQLETAPQKKNEEDTRVTQEKARLVNRAAFRP